jgi:RNA recognition motif-containing protein
MNKRLYVGNLSYSTTEAALSDLFGAVGDVVSVRVITERMTGRSKGFAFVEMAEESTAQEAINQLSGKAVDGRNIRVEEARPRRTRQREGSWGVNRKKYPPQEW